jgi:hypothetical protein
MVQALLEGPARGAHERQRRRARPKTGNTTAVVKPDFGPINPIQGRKREI